MMDLDLLVVANPVWEISRMVDRFPFPEPASGETASHAARATQSEPRALSSAEDGGGSALNSACALAAAGRRVVAVGRVGADAEGEAAVAALRRRGVDARIEAVAGRTTKRNHLFVDDSGATAFQVIVPSLVVRPWEEVPSALLEARWLLLDRLALAAPGWLRARRAVAGCRNALVRNSAMGTPETDERFRKVLRFLDYLQIPESPSPSRAETPKRGGPAPATSTSVPSRPESAGRGPATGGQLHRPAEMRPLNDAQVREILGAGVRVLIRTRGAEGALLHAHEGSLPDGAPVTAFVPALATRVLDPTGAGDAFAAGLLDGMLDGLSTQDSARRGADWAARACRHLGARAWLDHEPPRARAARSV
jgi:sugar/nucleoside kinase (ribokinase family)